MVYKVFKSVKLSASHLLQETWVESKVCRDKVKRLKFWDISFWLFVACLESLINLIFEPSFLPFFVRMGDHGSWQWVLEGSYFSFGFVFSHFLGNLWVIYFLNEHFAHFLPKVLMLFSSCSAKHDFPITVWFPIGTSEHTQQATPWIYCYSNHKANYKNQRWYLYLTLTSSQSVIYAIKGKYIQLSHSQAGSWKGGEIIHHTCPSTPIVVSPSYHFFKSCYSFLTEILVIHLLFRVFHFVSWIHISFISHS